jgi:hypothetical protein
MFARPWNLKKPSENSKPWKGTVTSIRSRSRSPEAIEKLESKP